MKLINNEAIGTKAVYGVSADKEDIEKYKQLTASRLSEAVKVPGFRPGKSPTELIFKYADQKSLQDEFLNFAVNNLYLGSREFISHRIIGDPKIEITKFVPFTTLEIKVEVPIIKEIKLPDYKNLKMTKPKTTVTDKLLNDSINELQKRAAALKPVKRPAKNGDLLVIDFEAKDFKTKDILPAASAKDHRLILGDKTLIPGFEAKLVGLSKGQSKSFDLAFPKDYFEKSFVGRKVNFNVTIKEVNSLSLPLLNEDFAKKLGPFKNVSELKTELKKQLQAENERQANIDLENKILKELAENTKVELDDALIESEVTMLKDNARQTALNRGQTWKEFLQGQDDTEETYDKKLRELAVARIKGGLAVGEIASKENINITDSELNQQIELLKSRYNDEAMQKELDNPNNRREIAMRLLTEKVLDFLTKNL